MLHGTSVKIYIILLYDTVCVWISIDFMVENQGHFKAFYTISCEVHRTKLNIMKMNYRIFWWYFSWEKIIGSLCFILGTNQIEFFVTFSFISLGSASFIAVEKIYYSTCLHGNNFICLLVKDKCFFQFLHFLLIK